MTKKSKSGWYLTGEARIVPSWFGFMRAELFERRDFRDARDGEIYAYQIRARSAGRLPAEFDGSTAFGFWSTLSTPHKAEFGMRAIFRKFIQMFRAPEGWTPPPEVMNQCAQSGDVKEGQN